MIDYESLSKNLTALCEAFEALTENLKRAWNEIKELLLITTSVSKRKKLNTTHEHLDTFLWIPEYRVKLFQINQSILLEKSLDKNRRSDVCGGYFTTNR